MESLADIHSSPNIVSEDQYYLQNWWPNFSSERNSFVLMLRCCSL